MTVGFLTTAIFSDLCGYFFGNVRDKTSNICCPLSACNWLQNEWPRMTLSANFTSKSVFDQQGCTALTFALARLSCYITDLSLSVVNLLPGLTDTGLKDLKNQMLMMMMMMMPLIDSLWFTLWLVYGCWCWSLRWQQMSHPVWTHRQIRLRTYVTMSRIFLEISGSVCGFGSGTAPISLLTFLLLLLVLLGRRSSKSK